MLFLPDTNAFSSYFRQRDAQLAAHMASEFGRIRLSALVLAELEYGATKTGLARHRQRVDGLLAILPVEPFEKVDASRYGNLRAQLERRGEIIGAIDLLIAAQALRLGATVVTHNVKEFSRVPGLKVEDWQIP